jgi:hypothetical protein
MNNKKYYFAYLLLFCNAASLRSDDRIIGAALFGTSALALATLHKNTQKPIDPTTALITSGNNLQAEQQAANVRANLRKEKSKQPLLLTYTDQWHAQQKHDDKPCVSLDPLKNQTFPITISHLAMYGNGNIMNEIRDRYNSNHQRTTQQPRPLHLWDTEHFMTNNFVVIDNDGEELPANPSEAFHAMASQAQYDIQIEQSLYKQSEIIAQANFQIRHLAAKYDQGIGQESQAAQDVSRNRFAQDNDRLGKWQYMCDHIKQIGAKRVNINTQWSTEELNQIWIAKQIYQQCKSNSSQDLTIMLRGYEKLNLQIQEALRTAIKEEIKSLKPDIDNITQNYMNQDSGSNSSSSSSRK